MRKCIMVAAALATSLSMVAAGHAETPECGTTRAAPPAELAGWGAAKPLAADIKATATTSALLVPGKAVLAALQPVGTISYPLVPERAAPAGSFGGLIRLTVTRAGNYRLALGTGAWLDVVKDDKALTSKAHAHGPACSGVRKMVDFALTPGTYIVQISGSTEKAAIVMAARLP